METEVNLNLLLEMCQYLKNWFCRDKIVGEFTIENGSIILEEGEKIMQGQIFRIVGSTFNEGLHRYGESSLHDETFTGMVWIMCVPESIISLSNEIMAWIEKNKKAIDSPFKSESFGKYSYSKEGDSSGQLTWQGHFSTRLNPWRKL